MTGSFALSIILFLSFSVLIDFVNYIMPQSAAASDMDIVSTDDSGIPAELADTLRGIDGVKEVYGRRSALDIPAEVSGTYTGSVDLISYDAYDLAGLEKDHALKRGSDLTEVYGDSRYVLATSDESSSWKIGDTVQIGSDTLTIAGLLKNDPFSQDGETNGKLTLITSGETFTRLTAKTAYDLIMLKVAPNIAEENIQAIQAALGKAYSVHDKRDQSTRGTYTAFVACVYMFLAVIALVTALNIVNSISISVSARMKQYGAMRAVGMAERQIIKMIAAEAFTYAAWGCAVGCIAGLSFSKALFGWLITRSYPYAVWELPVSSLIIILVFVILAAAAAVYAPAKRICHMPITAAINEL